MSSKTYKQNWNAEACEHFSEWDKSFYLWKSFSSSQTDLLKNYVGLALFGLPENLRQEIADAPDLEHVWYYFPTDQREIITEISSKFKFERRHVVVGHTYLYLDNGSISCVLRQMKSNNEITFIDCYGRVYHSWGNFCDTNRLPSCKFIAPDDGLHKVKQELRMYRSPAATSEHKLLEAGDVVAGSCSLVGVGLMAVAAAPVTAVVLGTVGTVYGIARSIGVLADRSSHEQSIGLDNAESIVAWSGIGTAAVAGASSMALSKSAKIVEASGKYGNFARTALKVCNYAVLTSTLCNFGTYAFVLQQRIDNGEELSSYDYLELAVNLFLVAGCVTNVRQMNRYINSLETTPKTAPARLTRTAKRKLQRMRAKMRANGVDCRAGGGNPAVKEVTILDEDIPSFGINMILNAGQQFINRHVNIQSIYMKCLEIWDTCRDFRYSKIGLAVFVSNMTNHIQNLFILVSEALVSIKAKAKLFLNQYFYHRSAPSSLIEQIGHMVENATTAVKKMDEKSPEEDEPEQPCNESKSKMEMILEAAKNRIPPTTQASRVISEFSTQLASLVDEIATESNDSYEEFLSKNIKVMGKIEAEKLFSDLNLKTSNDFANASFHKIMESKNGELTPSSSFDAIMQKVLASHKRLLAKVEPQSILGDLGTLDSCQLLKHSVTEFFNPLGEKFATANDLYDINVSFLGHPTAMRVVQGALKVTSHVPNVIDYSTFFDLASKTLNFDKIAEVLSATISVEKPPNKVSHQLEDENIHTSVLLLCNKFYLKVKSMMKLTSDAECERRIKHCYRYLINNFVDFMEGKKKEDVDTSQYVKLQNSPFSNQQSFVQYYRKLNEINSQEMFASAVEYFNAENNLEKLASEYSATCKIADNFHVPVCDEISQTEDGMRIFSINEGTYSNMKAYKSTAAKIFGLNEYNMELQAWEKGAVILKCGYDREVIFQNVGTKSMIVMEVDTSKDLSVR